MVTGTPVALVNASRTFTNASSSDCTKYFHRSMDSWAPGSGFHGAFCAQARAHSSSAGPVNAPAAASAVPLLTRARRVRMVMLFLPVMCGPCWSRVKSLPGRLVKQMRKPSVRVEPDQLPRFELMALAENGDDLLAAEFCYDLQLRAGWFDHVDFGLGSIVSECEMLRAYAINHRTPVAP